MTVLGLDWSSCQGIIPPAVCVQLAARDIRFAYGKAATGNDGNDPCFAQNVRNLSAAGIACGGYGFFYPLPVIAGHQSRDPVAQADAHWKAMSVVGNLLRLPPLQDNEWPLPPAWASYNVTSTLINDASLAYLERMEMNSGRTPGMYTMPYYGNAVGFSNDFLHYWLHAAEYDVLQPIHPWPGYTILQTAGGKPGALSRRFQQPTNLPNGVPVDTDVIADEATFQQILAV